MHNVLYSSGCLITSVRNAVNIFITNTSTDENVLSLTIMVIKHTQDIHINNQSLVVAIITEITFSSVLMFMRLCVHKL